ncbi:MAG: sulfatase [Planctomycetes bacterium]|nr:sulfatase [Planctomycetota bacterium]
MTRPKSRYKLIIVLLIPLLAFAAVLFWWTNTTRKQIKNILLISIDTCRADHLSCYGFERTTTPNIDMLAQTGVIYKNAYSPIPLTLPAHSSIFTGTYPPFHKVHENLNNRLDENALTLAEILKEKGFATGAVISSYVLHRLMGTNQGFDTYLDQFEQTGGANDNSQRKGENASQLANQFLNDHKDDPFFLFLHYFDPHSEYDPPEPFATEYKNDLYSGEIAYVDYCLSQVIEQLNKLDLYDNTLIVIVGDHGESLGEHGETEHGYFIYQSTTRVPFIIRAPGMCKPVEISI